MKNKIYSEIQQIDLLIKTHDLLVDLCRERSPNATELAAAASILFSFYSGLKRMFAVIRETGAQAEQEPGEENALAESAYPDEMHRPGLSIFSDETLRILKPYELFHRSYLDKQHAAADWNEMKEPFLFLKVNWAIIKKEILHFVE